MLYASSPQGRGTSEERDRGSGGKEALQQRIRVFVRRPVGRVGRLIEVHAFVDNLGLLFSPANRPVAPSCFPLSERCDRAAHRDDARVWYPAQNGQADVAQFRLRGQRSVDDDVEPAAAERCDRLVHRNGGAPSELWVAFSRMIRPQHRCEAIGLQMEEWAAGQLLHGNRQACLAGRRGAAENNQHSSSEERLPNCIRRPEPRQLARQSSAKRDARPRRIRSKGTSI